MSEKIINEYKIYGTTLDPVYIGTGGYNIGRVDNTIVRDTITKVPKIPGSSLGGTWRYYMSLKLQDAFKDEFKMNLENRRDKEITDMFENGTSSNCFNSFDGNRWAKIKCAGQDDDPNKNIDDSGNTGHCGHCIVCKSFGYSKKDKSEQGRVYISDMNILFFPVYTYLGVKLISCERVLKDAGIISNDDSKKIHLLEVDKVMINKESKDNQNYINLGYLNLPVQESNINLDLSGYTDDKGITENLIIVPNELFSQIVNANLEVRTGNSIDPITGAAKDGALFTSESMPRLTVLYGSLRIQQLEDSELSNNIIKEALDDSKEFYKVMGIGGMSTRGFGRIDIELY